MRNRTQSAARRDDDASIGGSALASIGKRTLTSQLGSIQRKASDGAHADGAHADDAHDGHDADAHDEVLIAHEPGVAQRKSSGGPDSDPVLPSDSGGAPMTTSLRVKMEQAFGADFSSVRIHEGPRSAALGARAFTQGTNLHFAPGEYQPGSDEGHVLIGHELAHVVQQSQGRVAATRHSHGVGLNDDSSLEREADEMGAKAARGEKVNAGAVGAVASGGNVVQREKREEEDLDYGFSGPRWKAMKHVHAGGDDNRGNVSPTVDNLNQEGRITEHMQRFEFFELLDYLRTYAEVEAAQTNDKDKHVVAWCNFLKTHIDRLDLSKQAGVAGSGLPVVGATKDRLNKNKDSTLGAPLPQTIKDWHDTLGVTRPADPTELQRLQQWVWNTFFRITSKLGLEFTAERGAAIHFNISKNAYGKALDGRDPGAVHNRNAITYSELRHLKRLHDRGHAPDVHFEDNSPNVHDVASPFQSLDLLDDAGKRRMFRTDAWKKESVDFELRLGSFLANKPEAKQAVQGGLDKMDAVMAKNNGSNDKSSYQEHRKVFGQKKESSAGQVGEDPATIRSVLKGTPLPGDDEVNIREQMTAFYNGGLWSSRGTTISQILAEIAKLETSGERKTRAKAIGIDEVEIEHVHDIASAQYQQTRHKIDAIAAVPEDQRRAKAKTDLGLKTAEAKQLALAIKALVAEKDKYESTKRKKKKATLKKAYFKSRRELARKYTSVNILANAIDSDTSRPAREKRGDVDRDSQKKTSQDYTDMNVPLSNREKGAIGGVANETDQLPWVEGIAFFKLDDSVAWTKEMKKKGLPAVTGNSGTTARMMSIFQWLHAGDPIAFRMAIMGWMLPSRDHSLMEILVGAKTVGVTGPGESTDDPITMYRNIAPLTTADLRANAGKDGLFPEERVLRTVSPSRYKKLIKQG